MVYLLVYMFSISGRHREDRHGGPESEQGGHQDSGLVPWPQGSQRGSKLDCLSAAKKTGSSLTS